MNDDHFTLQVDHGPVRVQQLLVPALADRPDRKLRHRRPEVGADRHRGDLDPAALRFLPHPERVHLLHRGSERSKGEKTSRSSIVLITFKH